MILLHGGMTYGMLFGILGGFVGSIWLFVFMLVKARRSAFYEKEYQEIAPSQKAFVSVAYIIAAIFISSISFYFFAFLIGGVVTAFE